MRLQGLGKLKNSNDLIGNQTCDLLALVAQCLSATAYLMLHRD
jgi:hypothetical protein